MARLTIPVDTDAVQRAITRLEMIGAVFANAEPVAGDPPAPTIDDDQDLATVELVNGKAVVLPSSYFLEQIEAAEAHPAVVREFAKLDGGKG